MSSWINPNSTAVIATHKITGEKLHFPSINLCAKAIKSQQGHVSVARDNPHRSVRGYKITTA